MIAQAIILSLALIVILYAVTIAIANIFHRSPDDIDTRPRKYRPQFPTK